MRNPNGFGCVYKRSGNLRKPYRAIVTLDVENNKQIRKTIGNFETSKDARKALALFDKGAIVPKENITLKELYEEWSPQKYKQVAFKTAEYYSCGWIYLKPLYNTKVKDLRSSAMQRLLDDVSEEWSQSTVRSIKVLLSLLLKYASQNDIVIKNYASFLKLPKEAKRETKIFTELEIKAIELSELQWADTVLIMIYTGMRISEMLSVTKFNVDLKEMTIKGGIKTDAGIDRIIPIHPKLETIIKRWYETSGEYLINKNGKKITADNYRTDMYKPVLKKIGVSVLNPHACRHTFATLLAKAGADVLGIQKIIGHSEYNTTAKIYTHTDIELLRKAIAKI